MPGLGNRLKRYFTVRIHSTILGIVLIGFIIAGLFLFETIENERYRSVQRNQLLTELSVIRATLEGALNSELLLARTLVTEMTLRPDITEQQFNQVCRHFMAESRFIRNIGLAKGTILTFLYPLEGNEAAIGLNYEEVPDQWEAVRRAIESRQTVVAGPVNLVQGGIALVGRTPVYVPSSTQSPDDDQYLGLVSVVIDIPLLFSSAGLDEVPFELAIRGKDGLGDAGEVFHGSEELFRQDPALLEVSLPDGTWQIAAIPAESWSITSPLIPQYRATAILFCVLLLVLIIARLVATEKRIRAEETLRINEERLRLTMDAARVYNWMVDLQNDTLVLDKRLLQELAQMHASNEDQTSSAPQNYEEELLRAIKENLSNNSPYIECDIHFFNASNEIVWLLCKGEIIQRGQDNNPLRIMGIGLDITDRKEMEKHQDELIGKLQKALEEIKTLNGLLPICSHCKKIRDDKGYWNQIEVYIRDHSDAEFSHGICPDCVKKLYPEYKQ